MSAHSIGLSAKQQTEKDCRDQNDMVSQDRFNPMTHEENVQTGSFLLEDYLKKESHNAAT